MCLFNQFILHFHFPTGLHLQYLNDSLSTDVIINVIVDVIGEVIVDVIGVVTVDVSYGICSSFIGTVKVQTAARLPIINIVGLIS